MATGGPEVKIPPVFDEPTDFCRLFLFRHPELGPAFADCAVGAGAAELGRRGRAQVLTWLEFLEPVAVAAVHRGPQPQCLGPARAVAEAQELEALVDERLRDQEMGRWQGRSWQDVLREEGSSVQRFFGEFGEAKAPGGESLGDSVERMLAWWSATMPQALSHSLVAVLPGSRLTGFAAAMLGMRLSRCVSLTVPHGGVGVLDAFQNGVRIATWNPRF